MRSNLAEEEPRDAVVVPLEQLVPSLLIAGAPFAQQFLVGGGHVTQEYDNIAAAAQRGGVVSRRLAAAIIWLRPPRHGTLR